MYGINIAKNTLYQVLARLISSGSTVLIILLIARHFPINVYGDFTKVTAFVSLFYLIADFGFNAIFLQHEENRLRFRDLLYSRISLGLLLIVIVNLSTFFLPYNPLLHTGFSPAVRIGIALFSFTILTEAILYTALAIFQRELKYQYFVLSSFIGAVVTVIGVSFTVAYSLSFNSLFISFLIAAVAEAAVALFFTEEALLPIKFDTRFFIRLSKETLPIGLLLVFNLIYFRIDIFLLSILRSSTDVALYDLAYKFFDFLIALPLFLSNALYPKLLVDQKNNRIQKTNIKKYIGVFILLALPLVAVMWIISPFIHLIKPDFAPASVPLRLLVLSLPVFFATSIMQWILITKKQQKFLAYVYLFSLIVNIILNLILIPQYGYIASAIITGISELGVFIVLWIKLFRKELSNI